MSTSGEVSLTERELAELEAWSGDRPERAVRVAIVRDAAAGLSVSRSAHRLGVSRPTVSAWRQRYAADGLAGLEHRPRSGRPVRVDEADVVAATLAGPPSPQRAWSARALADHLGISHTTVGRVWQRWRIRHDGPTAPVCLPLEPPLACARPELLATWARADGAAFLVVADAVPSGRPRTGAATADERRMRYAALGA
ncbi:helix-turn-helix domain-containing protein, partial [Streptomyces sp. 4503]